MSEKTLFSKLKVLAAKAIRAEKLYAPHQNGVVISVGGLNEGLEGAQSTLVLSELSNEVRSLEWRKRHQELRQALSDILITDSVNIVTRNVASLRDKFFSEHEDDTERLEKTQGELRSAVERQEFSLAIKLSLELIRLKASVQATAVLVDELTAVLDSSRRTLSIKSVKELASESLPKKAVVNAPTSLPSNVIPLSRARR